MRQRAQVTQEKSQASIVALCAFLVGEQEYVIDVARVEEVLQLPLLTALPRPNGLVEAVVNLRGSVVPVVDLRKHLRVGEAPARARPKLLVCLVGRRRVGLVVDGVCEVLHVDRAMLQPAPSWGPGSGAPYVIGACNTADHLRLLLNLRALWQPRLEAV